MNKNSLNKVAYALLALASIHLIPTEAKAQSNKEKNKKQKVAKAANAVTTNNTSFTKLPSGLSYQFVKDDKAKPTANLGDWLEMNINFKVGDSTMFDSKQVNQNKPVSFQLQNPAFKGDLSEGFKLMSAGDMAYFKVPVDSIIKAGMQPADWMKPGTGQTLDYTVEMISVKPAAVKDAEDKANAQKQVSTDENLMVEYFKKNNIKPTRTQSGLYYVITKPGSGANANTGQNVTVNYTGKTLDGNVFDSNLDPKFNHVEPFTFGLGKGQVIRGWDEGIALLNKGAKATLFIPSGLAYGERSPSPAIPPHSVLIFDVELVDMANAAPQGGGHNDHDGHQH